MQFELLNDYGFDWESGLARCIDDKELYAELLSLFLEDGAYAAAASALKQKDYKAMFYALHDLKGSSGNAGMTALYEVTARIVNTLRPDTVDEDAVRTQFADVTAAYEKICAGIRLLKSGSPA